MEGFTFQPIDPDRREALVYDEKEGDFVPQSQLSESAASTSSTTSQKRKLLVTLEMSEQEKLKKLKTHPNDISDEQHIDSVSQNCGE